MVLISEKSSFALDGVAVEANQVKPIWALRKLGSNGTSEFSIKKLFTKKNYKIIVKQFLL